MLWKKNWTTIHRWLGLAVGLQLLAWSIGGFTFSILDIDDVHGDLEKSTLPPPPLRAERVRVLPADALAAAAAHGIAPEEVIRVQLRERFERTVYELFDAEENPLGVVDAVGGEVLPGISEEQAQAAALADFTPEARVLSVKLLDGEPPYEFRGGPMPVYQVILDHSKQPHLYVSPVTGQVLKRRNKLWRTFDFFWMLHIMDYRGRDNFNHWLLTTMSALAILTSSSGLLLWWGRLPSWLLPRTGWWRPSRPRR